jgi:tetratricopeptide (TPR) repeat protein
MPMAHTRNAALAARIAELGMTERELAGRLNSVVEKTTGKRGRSTDRYVRLLLDGTIRWPWKVNRQALEQVLGRPILELGFIPRGKTSAVVTHRPAGPVGPATGPGGRGSSAADPPAGQAQEATMERREVLGIAAGATVSIVVPQLPDSGRVGVSDVARLRAPLDEIVAADQQLGGVAMAPVCVRHAERVLDVIRRYDTSDRVERQLYCLAGEYLAAAGWACVDAGELDAAGRHLDRAQSAAYTAQDPMLQARIANIVVMRAWEAGEYAHALSVSKGSLHSTAARSNPRVTALFHARVAHGHGFRGELGMAQRCLGRAEDALARVDQDTPTPTWLRFFNESELAALAALSYQALGRYKLAAEAGERATGKVLPGYIRNRTLYTIGLADAHLASREVEEAAAQAGVALELAVQLRDGVRRGRVAHRLRQLRVRMAQWPDVPEAQSWLQAHALAVRRPPATG